MSSTEPMSSTERPGDAESTDLPAGVAPSVLELFGNTPLVRLGRLSEEEGLAATLAMKMETTNPGGSTKDRPALQMILDAEAAGELVPGGTIVEPTSGNTGVGLAIVAAQRGYDCIFVMTDKVAPEKVDLLRAYGAEVVVCPVAVAPEDPESYYSVAERLVEETPNAYRPNQYANPSNPAAHTASTGPELWAQTEGRITHFVAGAGTCGTITGVATYLKAQNPEIQIIAADPEGSVFSGGSGRPYLVEGVGEDFFPDAWNTDLYDGIIAVSDADSFSMARRVARTEGILVGGSGGMAVAAALRVAAAAGPDDLVVVLNPDSGRGYLSKVFNDDWMANFGFTTSSGPTLADAIERSGGPRDLLYVNPEQPVREAIDVMRSNGISQLPVCKNTPPFAAAEVMGSVDELVLMRAAAGDRATLDLPVESVLGPSLPTIGIGQEVNLAIEQLRTATALLVLGGGRPCCILTRSDVLGFLEFGDDPGGDRHVD